MRDAAARWLARRHGVTVAPEAVLPVIGTKEFIAWLPTMLGCGAGDTVVYPSLAYPTYDAGVAARGCHAAGHRRHARARPAAGPAGLGELALQPDREGAATGAPEQNGGLGPRARDGPGLG